MVQYPNGREQYLKKAKYVKIIFEYGAVEKSWPTYAILQTTVYTKPVFGTVHHLYYIS